MNGVELIRHSPRQSDERGSVFAYIPQKRLAELLLLHRKKGSVSGNHYHKGSDPTRNPEIQYLISGKFTLSVKDMRTNETGSFTIEPNTELRIAPMIAHKLVAEEDSTILEFHCEISDYRDMIRVDI